MTSPLPSTASDIIKQALAQWGLQELYSDVDRLIKEGLGEEAISVQLQQTEAYKRRFSANEERQKLGLRVLSPAEYLSAEASYRQVMQSYGLPQGFWDSTDDFRGLISRDVSPQEVNDRVARAQEAFLSADTGLRQAWREMYGLSDGAGIAALLDVDRAMPIVERMANAAKAGASASRNGLSLDRGRLETYADRGYSQDALDQGFSQIGQTLATEQAIAHRFGQQYTQADAEAARIEQSSAAVQRQRELAQSEKALFDARAAADEASLNRRTTGRF